MQFLGLTQIPSAFCSPIVETRASERFQGASMENRILPSPSRLFDVDFPAESSRKRKSSPTNYQRADSGSVHNFCFTRESNLQCNSDSTFRMNISGNALSLSSKQYPQSLESCSAWHQSEKDQFCGQNDFALTCQTGNGNFHNGAVDRIRNFSPIVMSQSSHDRGPLPLCKMSAGGFLAMSNQHPQEHDTFSKTEVHIPLHCLQSFTAHPDNEAGSRSGDLMTFGHSNQIPTYNFPLEVCKPQSDNPIPLNLLHQAFLKPDNLTVELDAKACSQEATESGIPCDIKQSGPSFNHISKVGRAPLGVLACSEHSEDDRLLKSGNAPSNVSIVDNFQDNDKGRGDENIHAVKKKETIDHQNMKRSLTQGASPLCGYSPAGIVVEHGQSQRDDQSHNSLKSDERSKFLREKVAPNSTEKLWDGSLQLSSSDTVSTLAFFKSGEKMPDVKWSEFVEVKGKVRLEAFEKYIQDLPRSRNRGLMVISLCWKEGSPKTGLASMKEVAEKYKKGEKVGFAQLSPGVDLYICPRSDTIFTVLAKHGFLKGMAAVEDNQDSLIGCVVWRRNQASSSSVEKKSERKNQSVSEPPFHSPSESSTKKGAKKISSRMQEAQKSSSNASTTDFAPPEDVGNGIIESKSVESRKVQFEACNSSTNANSLVIPSVQGKCLSVSVEAPLTHFSELEKFKASLELQKPVMPLPPDVKVQSVLFLDNDDLPEFDFNTACRTSQAPLSKLLNAAMVGVNQGMPLPKKVCLRVSDIPFVPISQENYVSQSRATVTPATSTVFPPPKNLFGDDDDMPEWSPPDLHFQNQSLAESFRPSITPITSRVPKSTFKSLSHGPPQSLFPSPSPGAAHPLYCFQEFPRGYNYPTTITVKPALPKPAPMQRDPKSSGGFNPNPVLMRPPHNPFDVNLPSHSTSWRGWRPC